MSEVKEKAPCSELVERLHKLRKLTLAEILADMLVTMPERDRNYILQLASKIDYRQKFEALLHEHDKLLSELEKPTKGFKRQPKARRDQNKLNRLVAIDKKIRSHELCDEYLNKQEADHEH